MLVEYMKKITQKLGIESNIDRHSIESKNNANADLEYWEIQNEKMDTDAYVIYRCDNDCYFEIEVYDEINEQLKNNENMTSYVKFIFVFDNLEKQTEQFDKLYKKGNAEAKKRLRKLFYNDSDVSIVYTDDANISFSLEDNGINYLEYHYHESTTNSEELILNGYIYNISYFDLEKLFLVQGNRLFRKNIRIGITKQNQIKNEIEKKFKEYILNGLFNEINIDNNISEEDKRKLKNLLTESGYFNTTINLPETFWFNHNGVTIYIENSNKNQKNLLNRENNHISFNSDNAHIINGAQTMTKMYNQFHEITMKINELINKDSSSINFDIKATVQKLKKDLKIKTIFIEGDTKYVKTITGGLNTQIAISEIDKLPSEEETKNINDTLKDVHIKIIRPGEYEDNNHISVLTFAKLYCMSILKPGKSKNLNRDDVDSLLKNASNDENLASNIKLMVEADYWWVNRAKNEFDNIYNKENKFVNILKYGKNYFCSYVMKLNVDDYSEEILANIFYDFIDEFKTINNTLEANEFKKDDLFEKIEKNLPLKDNDIKSEKQFTEFESSFKANKSKILKFLNREDNKNLNVNIRLSRYFKDILQMDIDFRTITREKNNKKEFYPKETFPFSNKSFTEIIDNYEIKYEKSLFNKEIEKTINLFVLDKENKKIIDIHFLSDFTFSAYNENAKKVFEETLNAFKIGDETLFPKSSNNISFHIRPKALNAEDTFEFSNGTQITKRAFYANKETIAEILEKQLNENKS